MHSRLLLAVLCLSTPAYAAPRPSLAPPADGHEDESKPEAVFAHQLLTVCNQIAAEYVRPVTRFDLLDAALQGLYEAARQPAPPWLRERLAAAIKHQEFADRLDSSLRGLANVVPPSMVAPMLEQLATVKEDELIELIRRAREEVGDAEALRGRNALVIACQALTRQLDPHSGVVTAEEQRRTLGLEQEGNGVGVEVREHHGGGPLVVTAVHLGSPAQRLGLRPGDRITHLDGKPVQEFTDEQVMIRLTQGPMAAESLELAAVPPPPPVALTFERAGKTRSTTLTIDPARFRVENVLGCRREEDNNWCYWLDGPRKIACVRVANLARGSSQELQEVVDRLHNQELAGLILDLRWCPGGYLDEAVDVARLFLNAGVIATEKRRGNKQVLHCCERRSPHADFPMIVLVNGETSGGAEMIAAALQDHGRARVAGQRTLGKASVQTPIHLGVGQVGMKLTSGDFYRPSGTNLHRFPDSKDGDNWGVSPDAEMEFRMSADYSKALRQWHLLHALRPGDSTERLPLDDPTADPQRQAAMQALATMIIHKTVQAK